VARDPVRHVRLLQLIDFRGGEPDADGSDGIVQVLRPGRADDRRGLPGG
jgi:hypothetical protein